MQEVLFIDVQASGNPGKGILLEVAWKKNGISHSFFVRYQEAPEIPARVKKITGITSEDLMGPASICLHELKQLLLAALKNTIPVAHYAVYEKRWLDWLTGLNLQFICTRNLARQNNPELISGTLRAVAGAYGYSLDEKRRALGHVLATEYIYNSIKEGVSINKIKRSERLSLPKNPGVYTFYDSKEKLLYIGKAKNLRTRVNSHFTGKQKGRHAELISRTSVIKYQETSSALDAAVLEGEKIYQFAPEYNIAGKYMESKLRYIDFEFIELADFPKPYSIGPFLDRLFLEQFLELLYFIKTGNSAEKIVDNFEERVEEAVFAEGFNLLLVDVQNRSLIQYGKDLFLSQKKPDEDAVELGGAKQVKDMLCSVLSRGFLLCRKSSVYRLLQGCEICWESSSKNGAVNNFVENSLTDHWNINKLLKMKILLGEIRRLNNEKRLISVRTRFGTTIANRNLDYLLSLV